IIARGKRRAPRGASPLVSRNQPRGALKVRNMMAIISLFQSFTNHYALTQGRRAARLPLAIIFRAFGAAKLIRLCQSSTEASYALIRLRRFALALGYYFAPSALCRLNSDFGQSLVQR